MHPCLCIPEIVYLVFELAFVGDRGRKTLASLARTCRSFSSPALNLLWHDLDSFDPLLNIFPSARVTGETQWATFRSHANRVRSVHGRDAHVSAKVHRAFVNSEIRRLPLLPNLTSLTWSEHAFVTCDDSALSLVRYFAGPSVTTLTLSLVRWLSHSPDELALFSDLPRLCPNVTRFSLDLGFSWDYEPYREVGQMVSGWPKLEAVRACALAPPIMAHLLSRPRLHTLAIDVNASSPALVGQIPEHVRTLTLGVDALSLATAVVERLSASPTRFELSVGMNEAADEEEVERVWTGLARLDASRLRALAIRPRSGIVGIPRCHALPLHASSSSISAFLTLIGAFRCLDELDLDGWCTAEVGDDVYGEVAACLPCLRTLRMGTAHGIGRAWPVATTGAVMAVLRGCRALETLHILFDGSTVFETHDVVNRRTRTLGVGCSPIKDARAMASWLRRVVPCLERVEHREREWGWSMVQDLLVSS